jgi:hypothetical protein
MSFIIAGVCCEIVRQRGFADIARNAIPAELRAELEREHFLCDAEALEVVGACGR